MLSTYLLKRICLFSLISFLIASNVTFGQDGSAIKGKIKDKTTGDELVGVSIVVKGKATAGGGLKATATDVNGEFSINASPDDILIISYIGFKSIEVKASEVGKTNIQLEQETDTLDEVVIVGYGTADKRDVATSLAKVSSREFNKGVITGAENLIEGKVAGLQISQNGDPGGSSNIVLRGASLNGQRPLFVVDGILLDNDGGLGARNPLNFINPNDIESMTVLKDAAATAIYGVRGANGVVQITTKAGKTGKPVFTYDASVSVATINKQPDMMDASEFRSVVRRKRIDLVDSLGKGNTNWYNEITRVAVSTQHNLGISGGFKKTNYYATVGYISNQGVLKKTSHERVNLSLKLSQKMFNDNLTFTLNSRAGFIKDELGPDVTGDALRIDPTRAIRNPDGSFTQYANSQQPNNPAAVQQYTDASGRNNRFVNQYQLEYRLPFFKALSLYANGSADLSFNTYNKTVYPQASVQNRLDSIQWNREKATKRNYQAEYYATFKQSIKDHSIEATAGYGYYQNNSYPVKDFYVTRTLYREVIYDESVQASFFARVNYNYKGILMLSGSLRRDGSSKFGPSNRWGNFPAVSGALRIIEIPALASLKSIFSELKLRASFGVTGNDQIRNYQWTTLYYKSFSEAFDKGSKDTSFLLRPNSVDPKIRWEQTAATNIAIDLGFFNGRLTTTVDFYRKDVNDLLAQVTATAGSNFSDQYITNIGKVRNQGVEVLINAVPVDKTVFIKNGFKWNLSYNFSYNENKIVKLDNRTGAALANFTGYDGGGVFGAPIQKRRVGDPIDAFYTYVSNKDASGKLVLDSNKDGIQSNLELYKDQNGDKVINESDRVKTGKPNPDVMMGLTSTMNWKKFDFQFTWKSFLGNSVYNAVSSGAGFYDRIYQNDAFNNLHNSVSFTKYDSRQIYSDYYVQNASFLKLTNVTLGYTFDQFKFMNLRTYLTGQNLLFITPYDGIDPEINGGIDNNIYPRAITFTFGINATFK